MGFAPRNGQWVLVDPASVSTPLDLSGAHVTDSGKLVGIYQRGGKDATGKAVSAHVALCRPNGLNLRVVDDATNELVQVTLDPASVAMEPLLEKADLPPGRIVDPDWTPEA